jgi:hypothetical protein
MEVKEMRKNLEITVEKDNIWKVSLEEICQMAVEFGFKAISYEKIDDKGGTLIIYLARLGDTFSMDGRFLSNVLVVSVIYSPVSEYKRLLIYDYIQKTVNYTDEDSNHRYGSTTVFAIMSYPHYVIKSIMPDVLENMKQEAKKMQVW